MMDVTQAVLALSGDGACFPIHADSDEALDGRRLTGACALPLPLAVSHHRVYLYARIYRYQ